MAVSWFLMNTTLFKYSVATITWIYNALLCQRKNLNTRLYLDNKIWPVRLICWLLDVKSHNYYSYQRSQDDEPAYQEMLKWVKDIANIFWAQRIKKVLNPVSRIKTAQLMKESSLKMQYKKIYRYATNIAQKAHLWQWASAVQIQTKGGCRT